MATLATTRPTLLDLSRRMTPDGSVESMIVELLTQQNEILRDMTWVEGNLPTGHRTTVRTGLPTPTWRKLNYGIQPTKSTTAQVTDTCGMLEALAEVDAALVELNGNAPAFRLSEDIAHIEGMNQEMAATLFYGNETTEPEAFTGLAPRFNSLSAENAQNIIVGGSSDTDNTSIWLVGWSERTVHGIIPKASRAGLQVNDLGKMLSENIDGANGRAMVYRTHYRWDAGLTVRDWRYVVRIPNIDKSALTKDASSGADLPDLMHQAIRRIQSLEGVTPVFYMSRNTQTFLGRQISAKLTNSSLTREMVGGVMTDVFQGIPIRRVDALAADEALVS